jgi:hypothetical protein
MDNCVDEEEEMQSRVMKGREIGKKRRGRVGQLEGKCVAGGGRSTRGRIMCNDSTEQGRNYSTPNLREQW